MRGIMDHRGPGKAGHKHQRQPEEGNRGDGGKICIDAGRGPCFGHCGHVFSFPVTPDGYSVSRCRRAGLLAYGSDASTGLPGVAASDTFGGRSPLTVAGAVVALGPGLGRPAHTFPIHPRALGALAGNLAPPLCRKRACPVKTDSDPSCARCANLAPFTGAIHVNAGGDPCRYGRGIRNILWISGGILPDAGDRC